MDALAQSHRLAFSSHGTYTIGGGLENQETARAVAQRIRADAKPLVRARLATFSDEAFVRPVELVRGNASQTVWFDVRHSTHYVPQFGDGDPDFRNDRYLTYLHRVNGHVEERLEPVLRTEDDPSLIQEWMYLHYQEEKKKGEPGIVLYVLICKSDVRVSATCRLVQKDTIPTDGRPWRLDHADVGARRWRLCRFATIGCAGITAPL